MTRLIGIAQRWSMPGAAYVLLGMYALGIGHVHTDADATCADACHHIPEAALSSPEAEAGTGHGAACALCILVGSLGVAAAVAALGLAPVDGAGLLAHAPSLQPADLSFLPYRRGPPLLA